MSFKIIFSRSASKIYGSYIPSVFSNCSSFLRKKIKRRFFGRIVPKTIWNMLPHPEAAPPYSTFQNTWYLWPLLMDIYKIFRKSSTNYVKNIRGKKVQICYPLLGQPLLPYYKTHDISINYEPISTKFSAIDHLYAPDMHWTKNNLKYLTPSWGSPTPPIFHISIYIISLVITNGYLHNFQEIIY